MMITEGWISYMDDWPSIPMAEKNDLKSFKCQFESDLGQVL